MYEQFRSHESSKQALWNDKLVGHSSEGHTGVGAKLKSQSMMLKSSVNATKLNVCIHCIKGETMHSEWQMLERLMNIYIVS